MKTTTKPARTNRFSHQPKASLENFCFYLGLNNRAPRTEEMAIHQGRMLAQQWANYPRALQSVESNSSALQNLLHSLPDNSPELAIAEAIVRGMFMDVPRSLVQNDRFHNLVCDFRHCLIRTPEQHMAAICCDLGVGIPKSHSDAERMGAFVVESIHQPMHAHRLVQRRDALYHSLRALPPGSREHKMAKTMVIRATNPRRVPKIIQRKEDYRKVATVLRQALKLG
ncbi:MAG: hypothetical protein QG642_615 [Patescibacteria group bacterium]|nr:hypothetical protein [Patescibacteria group bacterium]